MYKKDIKEKLRQYDFDFQKKHGRLPSFDEKEPVRHLYRIYNMINQEASMIVGERHWRASKTGPTSYLDEMVYKLNQFELEFKKKHGRMPTEREEMHFLHQIYAMSKKQKNATLSTAMSQMLLGRTAKTTRKVKEYSGKTSRRQPGKGKTAGSVKWKNLPDSLSSLRRDEPKQGSMRKRSSGRSQGTEKSRRRLRTF